MNQTTTLTDGDHAADNPVRCWLRVAMGVAGACALAAQAALELSALAMPDASYASQPQRQPPGAAVPQAGAPGEATRPCTSAPCAEMSTKTFSG
jgi:hypothetical protein